MKKNKIQIIVFCGPPCSGKTTLSKIISKQFNLPRTSIDLLRHLHFNRSELFTEENSNKVFELMLSHLSIQQGIWITEGFYISDARKNKILEISPNSVFIQITARIDILIKRLETRILNKKNSEGVSPETLTINSLKEFYPNFKYNHYINLSIDTSFDSISKSQNLIVEYLNQKLFHINHS